MAPLVDYPSSEDDDDDDDDDDDSSAASHNAEQPPPAKKHRGPAAPKTHRSASSPSTTTSTTTTTTTILPPLPAAFHNLYAHTTRPAPTDHPALHQNRRRTIPHVDGNWPSHIFVEWHPSPPQHALLTALLAALTTDLAPLLGERDQPLITFLTSDLLAPLPLHVSLSRPFVLRTAHKAAFLDALAARIAGAGAPFTLGIHGLAWFRSRESGRSFLVLRVRSSSCGAHGSSNPELAALLRQCNALVGAYGQPRLYARSAEEEDGGGVQPVDDDDDDDESVDGDAFHVSIAWTFAEPTAAMRARTAAVFARDEFRVGVAEDGVRIAVREVKVKIGNVVTSLALGAESGRRKREEEEEEEGGSGLFGF